MLYTKILKERVANFIGFRTLLEYGPLTFVMLYSYDWQFVAMTFSYRKKPSGEKFAVARGIINSLEFVKPLGDYSLCPYEPSALFSAIEVNYPVLMTPVMMVAKELPMGQVQEYFYKNYGELNIRNGPILPNSERVQTNVPIEKADFTPTSVLMSPPIIFQTRAEPSSTCPYDYSTEWLQSQLKQVTKPYVL